MKLFLRAVALSVLLWSAQAHACDDQTIEHVSASGDIIELDDGTEWEVTSGSAYGWSDGDEVLVCDDTMTNKSNGERVEVTQR
jgi:hypothetical protein